MKNLLYFCVFYNNNYFKLLNLLLTSLKFFSKINSFDILILTSKNMRSEVEELSKKNDVESETILKDSLQRF
jgi:hypothetical protein